ncbi:MAG: heavy-metal-associated domain-containing protein [Rickettsiales bacterium]|nr:heavy-metal-associated domain-containing protein [Rickettsiales bacterium]
MRKFIYFVICLILSLKSFAYNHKIDIDVNGLVCEFCAVTIEKGFEKKTEIQEVTVDLEAGKVFLTFTEGNNLTDAEITDIIVNNGYNVAKINRNLDE